MMHLHFTLGPVQGFVAEARRTRDLWAGSFLLSWICANAMKAVLDGGGKIIFPIVHDAERVPTDQLLKAVCGQGGAPRIGTIPNRFRAEVPDGFDPAAVEQAARGAWENVADAVWRKYVEGAASLGRNTRAIWDRQVHGFWELNWAMGKADQPYLLDLRKNWRCFQPTEEGGEPCSVASGLQEISGYVRACGEGAQQDAFWKRLRSLGGISEMELRPTERLSAIMLIKRLFLGIANASMGFEPQTKSWPSTAHVATLPFKRRVIAENPAAARDYVRIVKDAHIREPFKERQNAIPSLPVGRLDNDTQDFAALDGDLLFPETFEPGNRRYPAGAEDTTTREALAAGLKALLDAAAATGAKPSPFFAVLFMDGDSMGKLLSAPNSAPENVSTALARFADQVEGIVKKHDGFTIYAGGDDVLALLPVTDAIDAAIHLKDAYCAAFAAEGVAGATISGGIVFAHYGTPWIDVMHSAHDILEGKAKEEAGRNSLGIVVNKGGATNGEWVAGWDRVDALRELARILAGTTADREISMSLLYRMRSVLAELAGRPRVSAGGVHEMPDMDLVPLLQAALEASHEHRGGSSPTADHRSLSAAMVNACSIERNGKRLLMTDGLVVARFIAAHASLADAGGSHVE